MISCPKCGFEQHPSRECVKCGIVIDKYLERKSERHLFTGGGPERKKHEPNRINKAQFMAVVFLICSVLFVCGLLRKNRLPDSTEIMEELYQDPIQTISDRAPFEREVGGIVYTLKPLYEYTLYGMVVSYHHSEKWWNIYHQKLWNDFINIKDICVVWGSNVETELYKDMRFSSGTWTCRYTWPNADVGSRFDGACLSNNHLLSDDRALNKTLLDAGKGDQVYLRGYLVEYSHGRGAFHRGTSTKRTDTGNGACETIYLEEFRILKKANLFWRAILSLAKYGMTASAILGLIFLFTGPVKVK